MKTAADRLKFAIGFVNADLKQLRPGDWLNLKDDLMIFLHGGKDGSTVADIGGLVATAFKNPLPQDYTEEDFRALQDSFKSIFDNLTATEIHPVHIEGDFYLMSFKPLPRNDPRYYNVNILHVSGPTKNMAILVLMGLLSNEPGDRVLRCPECNNYFYRIKKQAYCSRACVNRVTVREWRKTEEGKRKESDSAHKRYEKRVKKKFSSSSKVKVSRKGGKL